MMQTWPSHEDVAFATEPYFDSRGYPWLEPEPVSLELEKVTAQVERLAKRELDPERNAPLTVVMIALHRLQERISAGAVRAEPPVTKSGRAARAPSTPSDPGQAPAQAWPRPGRGAWR